MIRIVYKIDSEHVDSEVAWLRSMFIFPAIDKKYNWLLQRYEYMVGFITDKSMLMTIKLRHPNISCTEYRK